MNDFNLATVPLKGKICITAGAGTGKTYTISHLYIRLLLECRLTVDNILVVTFTEAATEELRDRIRKLIQQALEAVQGACNDDSINALIAAQCRAQSCDKVHALLHSALYSFDEAQICTIHSFCQRILKENAFESRMRFDTELMIDQAPLVLETVQDYWRSSMYAASPCLVSHALNNSLSCKHLFSLVYQHLAQPDLRIIPTKTMPDTTAAGEAFDHSFRAVFEAWPSARQDVAALLGADALNRKMYPPANVPALIAAFELFLRHGRYMPDLFPDFIKLTTPNLRRAVKKGHDMPTHPFFKLCDTLHHHAQQLCILLDDHILALKTDLFAFVRDRLEQKKQLFNIHTFDDLLTALYNALRRHDTMDLVSAVRNKYHAALIDEFQDTDPVQCAIFDTLFAQGNLPLFLIGDPKQAIYSFRGADIFTFLQALQTTPETNQYTLRTNWRSTPGLIHAFNHLFTHTNDPFLFTSIPYYRAEQPPHTGTTGTIHYSGTLQVPLTIQYFASSRFSHRKSSDVPYAPISKSSATPLLCAAVTQEIARCLANGHLTTGDKTYPVSARDIAVLVRTRHQARAMKQALSDAAIPAVLYNAGNIFDTNEAHEINQILHAIVYPNNHGYIRAALCTSFIGLTGNALFTAQEQEQGIEHYYEEFRTCHEIWQTQGFVCMFARFLNKQQVRKKLLTQTDGDRRLTNVLHLQDLLQCHSAEQQPSMIGLLAWFSAQLHPDTPRQEEHELRLEKDDDAVQIVTMHKAKGLQYPIVFCPFTWDGSKISDDEFIFHDIENRRTFDLGSAGNSIHKIQAEKELLAENLRLLYVAVTRARYLCFIAWGRFFSAETSAPAYLFHKPPQWHHDSSLEDLACQVKQLTDEETLAALHSLADSSGDTISISEYTGEHAVSYHTPPEPSEKLDCRRFTGRIPFGHQLTSFSAIMHHDHSVAELRDKEYVAFPPAENTPSVFASDKNIFTLPRGAETGTLLHAILEQHDFSQTDTKVLSHLVKSTMALHGFNQAWHTTVVAAVTAVIHQLLASTSDQFRLSEIPSTATIREMEFYYPIQRLSPATVTSLLENTGFPVNTTDVPLHTDALHFSPLDGYMHGFIDLFFMHNDRYYIVDWKSNYLGSTPDHYDRKTIISAMHDNGYYLQYYIYTLAVHQYLQSRLPDYSYEKNFGGVFYIFIRGVQSGVDATSGIFFDKPEYSTIKTLREEVMGIA